LLDEGGERRRGCEHAVFHFGHYLTRRDGRKRGLPCFCGRCHGFPGWSMSMAGAMIGELEV
jgi:hypothetical protein